MSLWIYIHSWICKWCVYDMCSGIFLVFSGAEIRPHSQWNLGDFFSQFWKKNPNLQKKKYFFFIFFFFKIGIFIQAPHTQATDIQLLHFISPSIFMMAKVYVIAKIFYWPKMTIVVHYNKFPNLGVCHSNILNLKGPRAPSRNCKKKSLVFMSITKKGWQSNLPIHKILVLI